MLTSICQVRQRECNWILFLLIVCLYVSNEEWCVLSHVLFATSQCCSFILFIRRREVTGVRAVSCGAYSVSNSSGWRPRGCPWFILLRLLLFHTMSNCLSCLLSWCRASCVLALAHSGVLCMCQTVDHRLSKEQKHRLKMEPEEFSNDLWDDSERERERSAKDNRRKR